MSSGFGYVEINPLVVMFVVLTEQLFCSILKYNYVFTLSRSASTTLRMRIASVSNC